MVLMSFFWRDGRACTGASVSLSVRGMPVQIDPGWRLARGFLAVQEPGCVRPGAQVYPEKGTVSFSAGLHGWAFTLTVFADLYAKKFGVGVCAPDCDLHSCPLPTFVHHRPVAATCWAGGVPVARGWRAASAEEQGCPMMSRGARRRGRR